VVVVVVVAVVVFITERTRKFINVNANVQQPLVGSAGSAFITRHDQNTFGSCLIF
jgi:hypothetical protein